MASKQAERLERLVKGPAKPERFPSRRELEDVAEVLEDALEFGVDPILGRVCHVLAVGEPRTVSFENIGQLGAFVRRARFAVDSIVENLDILDRAMPFLDEAVTDGHCSIPADDELRRRLLAAGQAQ